jgi:hypothetical protein
LLFPMFFASNYFYTYQFNGMGLVWHCGSPLLINLPRRQCLLLFD